MTDTVTISIGAQVNLKFLEALKFGVTGSYTNAKATAVAKAYQIKLDRGQCGYFTFVPVVKEIWYRSPDYL
jgi:hypothetical protein